MYLLWASTARGRRPCLGSRLMMFLARSASRLKRSMSYDALTLSTDLYLSLLRIFDKTESRDAWPPTRSMLPISGWTTSFT
jgi:hypothetical protein